MKKILLLAGLVAVTAIAQEQTQDAASKRRTGPATIRKDPQQSRNEETTQIATNSAKGSPAINYKGAANVDEDLRQRVLVALSTGSVGTQGVIASDQLTDIKVAVTNRVVTLRGDVASEKNKATLAKRVAGLDGVKSVNNQLSVNPKARGVKENLLRPDGYSPGSRNERTQDGKRVEDANKK
jgi:osmotically-inducible protein OsmY